MMPKDVFSYIEQEESNFETDEIQVGLNWNWNFRNFVQLIFHLKNGVFFTGENDWMRAFRNIMEPMLNLAYWTEDIEVKDVVFFTEGKESRAKSFLLKKYHDEVYVREHDLDTLFDEITESDVDYGGALVQRAKKRPEIIPLTKIAFCDQTDICGNPMAVKYNFAPEKLREMEEVGWGSEANGATISIKELITLATFEKEAPGVSNNKKNRVPGKTIEVYILRGSLPEHYLLDNDNTDDYLYQVQVVAFYTDKNKKRKGVTLYRKEADEDDVMFHTSKEVPGRALGRGTGESLLHPQIWTNFLEIHKMQMLASGAKTPLVTDDPSFSQKNRIQEMENNEIAVIEDGKQIRRIDTIQGDNIQLYEKSIDTWFNQAQLVGSAFDPILGKEANSGTTFRGQERVVAQGRGLHDRRRGQRAKFIEKLYREWIIPDMIREIRKGKTFLAELSPDELHWVVDRLATNYANRRIKEAMLKGRLPTKEEQDQLVSFFKETFTKGGEKKLAEVLESEFDGAEIKMGINIAGKQKDLVNLSDKLLSIFQFIFANPAGFQQAMQIPALSSAFSDILEFSGMSIAQFSSLLTPMQQLQAPQQPNQQPAQPMALNQPQPQA